MSLKFTVDQGALASALSSVVGASAKKSTLPVLQCVRITGDGDLIRLDCTDLDLSLSAGLEAAPDSGVSGAVCVNARSLLQVVSALPDALVTLEADANYFVKITCGKSRFSLPCLSADEFPKLPEVKDAVQVVYGLADFTAALAAATPYCSTDETRYVLNGVLLDPRGCFVATDGHRLVKAPIAQADGELTRQVIVPAKACQQILRALSGSPQTDVTLDIGESHLSAALGGVTLTTRLIEGRFPEYENVIPQGEQANKITCGLEYLTGVVKRVSLVLEGKSNMLRIDGGTLSCQSPDKGEAREELLNVLDGGESISVVGDNKIGVSAGYLKAALDTLKGCDQCTLAWQDDMSPMTITGNGSSVLAVIMPMRI